jgi:hypothetical protein
VLKKRHSFQETEYKNGFWKSRPPPNPLLKCIFFVTAYQICHINFGGKKNLISGFFLKLSAGQKLRPSEKVSNTKRSTDIVHQQFIAGFFSFGELA